MILARIQTRIPLFKQNILTERGITAAATVPRGRAFISTSAPKRYTFDMAEECDKNEASTAKEELPPLTDHEFKNYNRLAERMELFVSSISALTYTRVMYKAYTCIYMHKHIYMLHHLTRYSHFTRSTTTSVDHGTFSGKPAPLAVVLRACPSSNSSTSARSSLSISPYIIPSRRLISSPD